MLIGELATACRVSTRALRYYEQHGLLHSRRNKNGYREYDESAVTTVHNIRILLESGLNTSNIRQLDSCLSHRLDHSPHCEESVALYEQRLEIVRTQKAKLDELEDKLEKTIHHLQAHTHGKIDEVRDRDTSG